MAIHKIVLFGHDRSGECSSHKLFDAVSVVNENVNFLQSIRDL